MQREELRDRLAAALEGRRLLTHPFYTRWSRGEVSLEELRSYAAQYRFFEAALPGMLEEIADAAPTKVARADVLRNLADEVGGPLSHLQLFDRFSAELDVPPHAQPEAGMASLLATYAEAVTEGPATGMAAILAYEAQAPEVSSSKAAGLRQHFGLSDAAVAFWDVHGTVDRDHAEWAMTAVARMSTDGEATGRAMRAATDAWWAFLEEREHEAGMVPAFRAS